METPKKKFKNDFKFTTYKILINHSRRLFCAFLISLLLYVLVSNGCEISSLEIPLNLIISRQKYLWSNLKFHSPTDLHVHINFIKWKSKNTIFFHQWLINELTSESLMPGFGVNFSSSSLISSANIMCSFLILSARFDRYLKQK